MELASRVQHCMIGSLVACYLFFWELDHHVSSDLDPFNDVILHAKFTKMYIFLLQLRKCNKYTLYTLC